MFNKNNKSIGASNDWYNYVYFILHRSNNLLCVFGSWPTTLDSWYRPWYSNKKTLWQTLPMVTQMKQTLRQRAILKAVNDS